MKVQEPMLPTVRCADEFVERFGSPWSGRMVLRNVVGGLAFVAAGSVLGWLMGPWGQGLTMLAGMALVFSLLRKVRRYFAGLDCPGCGRPAGSSFTGRGGVIHLRCRHCGAEAATDLKVYYNGGWPEKVPY